MPITPGQSPGCSTGIITAVVSVMVIGGVVAFLVSGGDVGYFPGFLIPLIIIFIVLPVIGRAVRNARRAREQGSSASASSPPVSTTHPLTGAHRPYRYRPDTGEEEAAFDEAPVMDEEEHRRAVSEIMARRRRKMKTDAEPVEVEVELADEAEPTEEEAAAKRQQSRDRSKSKLSSIAESIRERNRQLRAGADTDLPPGYTLCVNCGNVTKLTGKKTRCSVCGSTIESV
jgi:rubrerythrin